MNKAEFQKLVLDAYRNGTLLTPKHDPDQLHVTWQNPRSIWSKHLKDNFEGFINSGQFSGDEYHNTQHPHTPQYWTIKPDAGTAFTVPGSGVSGFSSLPTAGLDTLVVVSGAVQGLHMIAENSQVIQFRTGQGILTRVGPIT